MRTKVETASLKPPLAQYGWAEFLHCMEGIPEDVSRISISKPEVPALSWGLLACLLVTLAAMLVGVLPVWPFTVAGGRHPLEPMTVAIVIGMLLGNFGVMPKSLRPGVRFAYSNLLSLGIILLGVQLNFFDVLRLGFMGVGMSCFEIVLALGIMWLLTRWLRLSGRLGVLLGVGTAICGSSAIMATAPVIEAEESDVVFGVATVTLLGLIGMFLLPLLGHALQMTANAFGILDGLVIHAVPQVVAAGFAYSSPAGATATVIKMTRVCLLAPMVFFIGLIYARRKAQQTQMVQNKRSGVFALFPKFIFGFLAMALLRTIGLLPDIKIQLPEAAWAGGVQKDFSVVNIARMAASFCLIMSMAAVGLETKFSALARTGPKPFLAGLISSLVITVVILGLIRLLGIG
jgi:uncharacterized integral membrane protein (TIGR00698 family)